MRSTPLDRSKTNASGRRAGAGGARKIIAATAIIAGLLVSAPAQAAPGNGLQAAATSHGPAAGTAKKVKSPKRLPKALKTAAKKAKPAGSKRLAARSSLALRATSSTWKYLGHTGGHRVGNNLVGTISHYWTGKQNGYTYVVQKTYYCDLMSCTHQTSYWAVFQQGQWWGWYIYCTPFNSACIPAEFPIK